MTTTYGSKYNRDLDIAAIAKLVRADIKAAIKAGELAAAKYSVRIERYSGGQSMTVTASAMPFELLNEERVLFEHAQPHAFTSIPRYSAAARGNEHLLEIIMAAYNYDGSDSSSDYYNVNFHAGVVFEADEKAEREAILARNGRAA